MSRGMKRKKQQKIGTYYILLYTIYSLNKIYFYTYSNVDSNLIEPHEKVSKQVEKRKKKI